MWESIARKFSRLEPVAKIAHRVLYRPLRPPAQFSGDLARGDAVGAQIVTGRTFNANRLLFRKFLLHDLLRNFCQLVHRLVLITGVKNFTGDFFGRHRQQFDVQLTDIVDVNIRALLLPAENGDDAFIVGVIGQDIYREIEPHPRRIAADRRRPNSHAGEFRGPMAEEDWLAESFVLVVVGQRHERMFLRDLRELAYAVHRAARDIDEAIQDGRFAPEHKRFETI